MKGAERWAVALGAAGFLYLVLFRDGAFVFRLDPFLATVVFDEPARVAAGEVLYRDFFDYVGPGLIYLHAAAIRVFGPRIAPLGWLFVLVGAALACVTHRLAALAVPSRLRLLAPVAMVALVYAPNEMGGYKWLALLCGLTGVLALVGARRRGHVVAGGALVGAGMLFAQDLGAGIAAGVFAWLMAARDERRYLPAAFGGLALAIALPMGYFLAAVGAHTLVYDTILFPLTRYHAINRYYVFLRPHDVPGWARVTLGLGGLVAGLLALRPAAAVFGELNRERRRVLMATGCAGLAVIVSMAHRGLDLPGLAWWGMLIVPFCALLEGVRARGRALARLGAAAVTAVVLLGAGWSAVAMVATVQAGKGWTRERHRGGDVWFDAPRPELAWLEANAAVGQPTFFIPAFGGYALLSGTRNATSYPVLIDHYTPRQVEQALDEIAHRRPRLGLYNPGRWGPVSRPHLFFPPIEARLRQWYDFEILPNGVCLLRLKQGAAGHPDRGHD